MNRRSESAHRNNRARRAATSLRRLTTALVLRFGAAAVTEAARYLIGRILDQV
ncbi:MULTISPECIES: hypothetical protein [unclassified Streptomyces]|uniref:hypothetical protein n=1 Tax=unclassified Streptomyces TaxID=2593676 RepID=UPI002DD92EB5|nr:hypothetical protein [Streptomyces sp. NBC_01257]WRZ68916.1 hypothetical protein OG408_35745 [Streptomyces sp. NBC_01257]